MSELDIIFRKRLERIREELNNYIELHLYKSKSKVSVSKKERASENNAGDVQESRMLIHYDIVRRTPPDICQRSMTRMPSGSAANVSSGGGRLPEFSQKNREWNKLDEVLAKKEESFSEMLLRMIDEKGLKDSDVYKRANIDRRLFSKIRTDEDYVPSKKTAISFCLALRLELEEAKKLLATAGYTLSSSSKFDLIIMYLIKNCEYNINFVNIVLDDYGQGTLAR